MLRTFARPQGATDHKRSRRYRPNQHVGLTVSTGVDYRNPGNSVQCVPRAYQALDILRQHLDLHDLVGSVTEYTQKVSVVAAQLSEQCLGVLD